MENLIYDCNTDDVYGFYKDIKRFYIGIIKEYLDNGDLESAESYIEELKEVNKYSEYDGLLVLSNNNGMGFTCNPYKKGDN